MSSPVARNALWIGVLCLAISGAVSAEQPDVPMLALSGFGTLGVVHSSEALADFGSDAFAPNGAGYTRRWSPEVDSRLGAQLTGNFTPKLSATLQLISEQRYDGKYFPHVEWANIKYQFSPQLSVRLGRTALASFLVSDFRKVGYANPWVRPPAEVYNLIPVGNSDGLDVSYRLEGGGFVHTLLGSYGQTDIKLQQGSLKGRKQWVVSDTIEYGAATLRLAYQQVYVSSDGVHAFFDVYRQFGPEGVAIADKYDTNGKRVTFIGLGGMYDPGDWFVMAEWGYVNYRSVIGEKTGWYASGGYRIKALTPYFTYARARAISNTSNPGLTVAMLPPELAGPAAGLNAALNGILGVVPIMQSISAGARWDFMENVALKLQYDHINLGAGSAGTLRNVQPGFQPGGALDLFSVNIDFVW